jgi:hypothetical protein
MELVKVKEQELGLVLAVQLEVAWVALLVMGMVPGLVEMLGPELEPALVIYLELVLVMVLVKE